MEPASIDAGEPLLHLGEALVYGLIQGLTEFLPVSSSGHLRLAHLWGLADLPKDLQLPFDVLLHAATLGAIAVAFWRDILAAYDPRNYRFWPMLLLAVIPAGLLGLFGKGLIEAAGESWWTLAVCYVFTAVLLTVSELIAQRRELRGAGLLEETNKVSWKQALLVGLLQVPALFPGVSRSGSTVAAGLLGGMAPKLAVRFSFLVGLPLIAGAAAKDALDGGFGRLFEQVGWVPLTVAFISSLVSGILALGALKLVTRKRGLKWFAVYCLFVAVVCFVQAVRS